MRLPARSFSLLLGLAALLALAGASTRFAFAHYMLGFPPSIDDAPAAIDYYATQYLEPTGESSKWAAVGGFVRDRPLPVPVSDPATFRQANALAEIRTAQGMGLQGFQTDLFSAQADGSPQWPTYLALVQAADSLGGTFRILPCLDMAGFGGPDGHHDAAAMLAAVREVYGHPCALKVGGKTVVCAYLSDSETPAWWKASVVDAAKRQGMAICLWPVLQGSPASEAWDAEAHRTGATIGAMWWNGLPPDRGYTGTVLFGADTRPNALSFEEYRGGQRLRAAFDAARAANLRCVDLGTWNDYSEGTVLGPSANRGGALADLCAYEIAWFLKGSPRPKWPERLGWIQRIQSVQGAADAGWRGLASPADTLDVWAVLSSPATLTLTLPGQAEPVVSTLGTGLASVTVPIGLGTPHVRISRGDRVLYDSDTVELGPIDPARVDLDPRGASAAL